MSSCTTGAAGLEVVARPAMDEAVAANLASTLYGASGAVKELGSHQDRNYRVDTPEGPRVLKVANKSWPRAALEAQDAALLHIAAATAAAPASGAGAAGAAPAAFAAPKPVAAADGTYIKEAAVGGETLFVRLLTYVEGKPLSGNGYMAPVVIADLGRLAGSVASLLSSFEHPGLARSGQWDMRRAEEVVKALAPSIADASGRAEVLAAVAAAAARLAPLKERLRLQAIHSDVTDDNVVGAVDEAGRLRPHGIIDFGDLTKSWLVGEIAVTASCVLRHRPDDALATLHAIRAFHAVMPLTEVEVAALWPLIVLRGACLVASGEHQSRLDPDNESATGPLASEWRIFRVAASLPFDVAEAAIRAALGFPASPAFDAARSALSGAGKLMPSVASLAVVDLSSTSEALHNGRHLAGEATEAEVLGAAAAASPSHAACTRWGEPRLTRTSIDAAAAPATLPLGIDAVVPAGTALAAPWAVTVVSSSGPTLVVDGAGGRLTLVGVAGAPAAGATVAAGGSLGTVAAAGTLRVTLCLSPAVATPAFIAPSHRAGWLALCPDPSPLFGTSVAAPADDVAGLLAKRDRAFAKVQEHYYEAPPRIERGWQHNLIDTDGRCYLDMVNNVAAIGHGHPRMAAAVHRQMQLLNTNSRFHYAAVAEFCERLASIAPPGLTKVFLVNSGSEAVDLALRIAQVVKKRLDVLAVREAYHGVTMLSDAVTTSLWDNPQALETRPDWVHLASAPNTYRGRFRGEEAKTGYTEEMKAVVADMVAKGRPPAAFISEPVFGNAGGVMLPEGYLAATYEAVRAAGGLCIADEVQVGYGRLGHYWWAHQMHGVVPDMVTIAKAMGNGYPLGAVLTTPEIAEAFAVQGSFFSSAGGSPVSCVVGTVVLDVIQGEGLQANAARVGDFLTAKCKELQERYPMIGAVHGMGLYMGVELVRDRETREPATKEAYALCDRLRELGIICQPTGERANVLKMKPPMCLTMESAAFFVEQLEAALRDGW